MTADSPAIVCIVHAAPAGLNGDNLTFVINGPSFDAREPNVARAYDYALGGKDNFASDRALHAEILEIFPLAAVLVRENRQFLARAVSYVAGQGIGQFIEVGSGMPASPATHEIADRACPGARVVYVDNDPVVISYSAALLASPGRELPHLVHWHQQ